MSGHSKWSTIKRKKGATDQARGKLFSKLTKAISVAAKSGGGADPDANARLRMAIEAARAANMPKENIERAISRASKEGESLQEVSYEGYGPHGVSVIVEVATNNKNRTGQEIKNLFERGGGALSGPGSVSFNFDSKGFILLEKENNIESQILKLIDLGAEDVEETKDAIEVYVDQNKLSSTRQALETGGFKIKEVDLVKKPRTQTEITDSAKAQKVINFLEALDEQEDVQKVYANVDIEDGLLAQLQ